MAAKKLFLYSAGFFLAGLVAIAGVLLAPVKTVQAKNDVDELIVAEQSADKLYATYCFQCHGPKGLGDGPIAASLSQKPANLTRIKWKPDFMLALKIREGRGVMPSWKNTFNDEQISSLIKYIRTFESATKDDSVQSQSVLR